jgi:hypothetical protein
MTTPLTAAQQNALVSGLQGLSQWTGQLATYAQLGQQLPLVGGTLGNLASVSTAVQAIYEQLNALPSGATPQQIVPDLQSISTTVGSLSISMVPDSASESQASDGAPVLFTVDLQAQQTLNESVSLNSLVNYSQESFSGTTNISLQASLDFTFTFGIDESPNLTPAQMFLFQASSLTEQAQAFRTSVPASPTVPVNVPAQVGFLAGNIVGGSLSFAADVQVPLQNAGQMRLSDLQGNTAADMLPQLTDTGSTLSASLPFFAEVGSQTVANGATNGSVITVPQYDPFTGTASIAIPSTLSPFLNVSAQDISGLLSQLPGWADSLENSSAFSVTVHAPASNEAA